MIKGSSGQSLWPRIVSRGAALTAVIGAGVGVLATLWGAPAEAKSLMVDAATIKRGAAVYMQNCSSCHGLKGKGEGPVAKSYNPPPTDFTRGEFRHGGTDDDILKAITIGIPGTGMTGWKGKLSEADISAVAAYIRSLRK